MAAKMDQIDFKILAELQRDSAQSQRALSERVGLSQNACWRRLKTLETSGVIRNRTVVLDRAQLSVGLIVFVMVKTRHHSADWLKHFRSHVSAIPEVIDFFVSGVNTIICSRSRPRTWQVMTAFISALSRGSSLKRSHPIFQWKP